MTAVKRRAGAGDSSGPPLDGRLFAFGEEVTDVGGALETGPAADVCHLPFGSRVDGRAIALRRSAQSYRPMLSVGIDGPAASGEVAA
jgi:hypothetical protein